MGSLNNDFKDFVMSENPKLKTQVRPDLMTLIQRDLHPSVFRVFSKLLGIHAVVATLSMLICPQFGLKVFRHQPDLFELFYSSFGDYGCHLACGFVFMSLSILVAALIMTKDEVRTIRKRRSLFLGTVISVSFGFFVMTSPEIIFQGIAFMWILGAIASSSVFLELGWKLRTN